MKKKIGYSAILVFASCMFLNITFEKNHIVTSLDANIEALAAG